MFVKFIKVIVYWRLFGTKLILSYFNKKSFEIILILAEKSSSVLIPYD